MTLLTWFDYRRVLLMMMTASGAWAVITTEVLSFFHALYFLPVLIAWVIFISGCITVWRLKIKGLPLPFSSKLYWPEIVSSIFIVALMMGTLVTVIVSMSNSWDAMTYHLPRVMHWMQNHTLDLYPTHNVRQLVLAPGASYLVLQWGLLTGNLDKAAIVQWVAMIGSVAGISLIAKDLGFDRRVQFIAALLALTIPMGILQSVSTQNHYVAALWLIIFIRFGMVYATTARGIDGLIAALSLGLGILSKEVNYVFVAPFLFWGLVEIYRRHKDKFMMTVIGMTIIFGILNGGHLCRMISQTHDWQPVASLINNPINVEGFVVNVLRNGALNTDVPYIAQWATQAVYALSHWLGFNLNNPSASFLGAPFQVLMIPFDEDYAGSFAHGIAGIAAVWGLFLLAPPLRKKIIMYTVMVIMAFMLFCLIVRFQPWHMRFQLSLWLLACPVIAIGLYHINGVIRVMIIGLLIVIAMATMMFNKQHPWTGERNIFKTPVEAQLYYKKGLNEFIADKAIGQAVMMSQCHDVGFIMGSDSWQYSLWRQLQWVDAGVHLEAVEVSNESKQLSYPLGPFNPCMIVSENVGKDEISIEDHRYRKVWQSQHEPARGIFIRYQ